MNNLGLDFSFAFSKWEVPSIIIPGTELWPDGITPRYVMHVPTGDKYWNEGKWLLRLKSFALLLGTPLVKICAVAVAFFKVLSLHALWSTIGDGKPYDLGARLISFGKDLGRGVKSLIAIPIFELAALYGIFNPYDGRRMYGMLEVTLCRNPSTFSPVVLTLPGKEEIKALFKKLNEVVPEFSGVSAAAGELVLPTKETKSRSIYVLVKHVARAVTGQRFLAPCFQANPQAHFGGGDPNVRNAF